MCSMKVLVSAFISSLVRCAAEPVPDEPKLILPGLAGPGGRARGGKARAGQCGGASVYEGAAGEVCAHGGLSLVDFWVIYGEKPCQACAISSCFNSTRASTPVPDRWG